MVTTSKVAQVARIVILWSESPEIRGENISLPLADAQNLIDRASLNAPPLGYYKTKLTVTWDNGASWTTRLDIEEGHDCDILRTVKKELEFYAGKATPSHLTQREYAQVLHGVPQRTRDYCTGLLAEVAL